VEKEEEEDGMPSEGEVEMPRVKKSSNLPEGTNGALLDAFQEKINVLRKEVITDQSYYCIYFHFCRPL
jgi:hypothetical protein